MPKRPVKVNDERHVFCSLAYYRQGFLRVIALLMGHKDQGVQSSDTRYSIIPRVLVFLRHQKEVLLIKGAPDKRIWANLLNGIGGHVERDEDVRTAAHRELLEEAGLEPPKLDLRAIVNIDAKDSERGIMLFVFVGESETKKTVPSVEGTLHWMSTDILGQQPLVEDLKWLLPRVLEMSPDSEPLYLFYSYDENDQLVIRQA